MKHRLLFVMAIVLAVGSCTSIDCPVQNTVRTYYALQKPNEKTDTLKDTLNIRSARVNGTDTLLLNSCYGKTIFSLPIGSANPEDTLYFRFSNHPFLAVDTVWIKKENIPHFESVDCSASFFHNITAVRSTHHAIDSININTPLVDYDPKTVHFHLYLQSHD